jgi:tryptophan synthase alpha chain
MQTLFDQVQSLPENKIPKVWMGYVNQLMQFGFDEFLNSCNAVGIDTVIVPDMPVDVYESEFKDKFEAANVCPVFLITPQTTAERIRKIDDLSKAFIYMVSDASITGGNSGINNKQIEYFQRIKDMGLKNPCIIGFGISNAETYNTACTYASGAIIGSAFLKAIGNSQDLETDIPKFIQTIR